MSADVTSFSVGIKRGDALLFLGLESPGLITLSISIHNDSVPSQRFLWPEKDDKRILAFLKNKNDCREFAYVIANMFGYKLQEQVSDEEKVLFVFM